MSSTERDREVKMDADDLYLEEIVTDRRVGSIRLLKPVTPAGEPDTSRETLYAGQAQMLTPMGAIPLNFDIEAKSLAEAVEKFPEAANVAVERTARELQEMRREQASSLIVPEGGNLGGGGAGGPGGMPGGGKIQLK